jgi:putative NAD(P)-binding protein
MIKPRIIVTGATGRTGSVVASELLKAGYPVRAMVRREDDRSALLKAQGAEIAVADMSDVERIADALRDVQGAYYCPPLDPYMIQGAVAFTVAAKEARLERIVSLTQWLASPSHPSLMTRQHWLVDRLFSMTPGVAHTIVNPGFFADSYLGDDRVLGASRPFPVDVRQKPQRATLERGHRASRRRGPDESGAARPEELPPHRTGTPRRGGHGESDRPSRRAIGQGRADADLVVHEGCPDGRHVHRCHEQRALLRR